MNRQFLTQFLNKISNFPNWMKEIIYVHLSKDFDDNENSSYLFATYKPTLTYKGKCELDYKNTGYDTNIYNILEAASNNNSISDIILNTYLSMEEIAGYILFMLEECYFEAPENPQILRLAKFISGKTRTGEYFKDSGIISDSQLSSAIESLKQSSPEKKFGQILLESGLISRTELNRMISIKEEAKKRFILDYNEVPIFNQSYSKDNDKYQKEIEELKTENAQLKKKLANLLAVIKN